MNWEAIGAVAELLGAIAVFATLAYLSVQIRHSNIVMREQAQYHMLQNQIGYFDRLAENPDLIRIVYHSAESEEQVRERQHEAHIVSLLFKWNWEFLRFREGIFGSTDVPIEGIRRELRNGGYAAEWSKQKYIFNPEFVEFMDTKIIPDVQKGDA